mgnify:CR=1 FL=1
MLVERKTLCAERDTLVELNVTTNDTCGSDYHTRAVVDGEVFANLCPRVNVDARFAVCQFRNDTRNERHVQSIQFPTLELKYSSEDSGFHSASTGHIALAPELGFLFPAFDDRAANIYNALFYSKNAAELHQEVIDAVFRTEPPMSAEEQKNVFGTALGDTLQKECSYDVVQSVHEQLRERIAEHKESHDPEVLTLSIREVGDVLTNSGVSEEKAEAFQQECRRQYGEDVTLNPKNIIDSGKFQITTPEVKIAVAPEYSHMIEARVIDGRRYILIPADEGVEINGIGVNIPNPQRAEETEHEVL